MTFSNYFPETNSGKEQQPKRFHGISDQDLLEKVIDPFVNTLYKDFLAGQITEQEISEKLQEILGFSISLSQCHDEQVTRLVGATGMPTDCIFK